MLNQAVEAVGLNEKTTIEEIIKIGYVKGATANGTVDLELVKQYLEGEGFEDVRYDEIYDILEGVKGNYYYFVDPILEEIMVTMK